MEFDDTTAAKGMRWLEFEPEDGEEPPMDGQINADRIGKGPRVQGFEGPSGGAERIVTADERAD